MLANRPRFVLLAETDVAANDRAWRFVLCSIDEGEAIVAGDAEPSADERRLALLAVVRGLEALDEPSDVTLVTGDHAVIRGIEQDLEGWRNNHWRERRDGHERSVRDADLWRRIDRALSFHRVRCRPCPMTRPAAEQAKPGAVAAQRPSAAYESRGRSPAMVIVPGRRSRRRIRIASRSDESLAAMAG